MSSPRLLGKEVRGDRIFERAFDAMQRLLRSRLPLPLDLRAEPFLLDPELGRELLAEVLGLEHRPDLDHRLLTGHRVGAAPDPLDRLLHRLDLPEPEAGDELLGLGEGAVHDSLLAAGEDHALALRTRVKSLAREH